MYLKERISLNLKSLIFLVAVLPGLVSCDSDDGESSTKNTITQDGTSFNIQSASILGVSMDGDGHAAINFVSTDGTLVKTLSIDFEYSADQSVSGTYSYPQSGSDRYLDEWLTTYTEMTQSEMTVEAHLEAGTVTVKDNGGSNYTVTIDLVMDDGRVFKGTYQGKMTAVFNNS